MRITALQILTNNLICDRTPVTVVLGKAFVIHIPELFVMGIQQSE